MLFGVVLASYFLGAIPWAYVVARVLAGVDIRRVGDGNIGAKNVFHQVGHAAGVVVGLLDIVKGTTAVWLARGVGLSDAGVYAAGVAAVLGHDWSPYLRLRGGQGFAVTVGVLLGLMPRETLLSLAVVALTLAILRRWDPANAIGFALLPLTAWWLGEPLSLIVYACALLPLVGVKKLLDQNIRRQLAAGGGGEASPLKPQRRG